MAAVVKGTPEQRAKYTNDRMKALGKGRVLKAQEVCREGAPDQISGRLAIAFSFRETGGRNVLGDKEFEKQIWHARGAFQIYDSFHWPFLKSVVGCPGSKLIPEFTRINWIPVKGTTAAMPLMVPTWEDGCRYYVKIINGHIESAYRAGVRSPSDQLVIAANAYNCGFKKALLGYEEGEPDKYTTLANYSTDVLLRAEEIGVWLREHPNWLL